jgi:exodeoxyribonuclease VII small subunit
MAKLKRDKDRDTNFEQDLEQLESIVNALEEGGLPLDDSLKRFEEGIQLARRCEKALTEAEKRIEILLKNADGELEAQPFGEEAASAPAPRPAKRAVEEPVVEEPEEEDEDGELLF